MADTSSITRKEFSVTQRLSVLDTGFITDALRKQRGPAVTTIPIDAAHPLEPADRDDGIVVERVEGNPNVAYHVTVTVADIAGYVAPDNPLSHVGHDRGFTEYWPWSRSTMFPDSLENRMSLEHHQERLGMAVTIDLDAQYRPVHTELKPVLCKSECHSYPQAQALMDHREEPFRLMQEVARGICAGRFGSQKALWKDISPPVNGQDTDAMSAMKMVSTYMLLANQQVAKLFADAKLPFIYRNFEAPDESADVSRAYYSTQPMQHDDLKRVGLDGPYCHFTSPIRRGPDFYDGHMAHYAIAVLNKLEHALHEMPACAAAGDGLHRLIWDHAPRILQATYHAHTAEAHKRFIATEQLRSALSEIVTQATTQSPDRAMMSGLQTISEQLATISCPYDERTLAAYAEQINTLAQQQRDIAQQPDIKARIAHAEDLRHSHQRLAMSATSTSYATTLGPDAFSSLLLHAARTGKLPDDMLQVAIDRIEHNQFNRARDTLTIMIHQPILAAINRMQRDSGQVPPEIAPPSAQDAANWDRLKSVMATAIKHDPGTINNVFSALNATLQDLNFGQMKEIKPHHGIVDIEMPPLADKSQPLVAPTTTPAKDEQRSWHIHKALYAIPSVTGEWLTCPFWSLGVNKDTAESHAKYSFIEHFAFGQMVPISEARVPHQLYEQLNNAHSDKLSILQEMAASVGGKAEVIATHNPATNQYDALAVVHGGAFVGDLTSTASDKEEKAAINRAIRRMFRNETFCDAVSLGDPIVELFPHEYLLKRAAEQSPALRVQEQITQRQNGYGRTSHQATVSLVSSVDDAVVASATQEASKKSTALAMASRELLQKQQWVDDAQARGWATEVAAERTAPRTNGSLHA